MAQNYRSEWWQIQMPADWFGEREKGCVSFVGENGVGALQISAYRKDEKLTDDDLEEFAENHIAAGAKLAQVEFGFLTGFTIHFGMENEYWRFWWLRCD